jgi:predicted secreted protein
VISLLSCLLLLAQQPTDDVQARFDALAQAEQREVLEYLEMDLDQRGLFARSLIRFALASEPPPAQVPQASPTIWFDPQTHAPAQPIPRRWLEASDTAAKAAAREILGKLPARKLESGFRYEPGERRVVRLANALSSSRIFANACNGYSPGHDQAEAVIERLLDDGAQQRTLAAFAHAYTDRLGKAYPGITLYDAWASGADLEMPDVDTLGLYHSLKGNTSVYVAPIPGPKQEPLYKELGEFFQPAHRHRGLRRALAACFLEAQPQLRDGYGGLTGNFHMLWEEASSTPATLLQRLPESAAWRAWLDALAARGTAEVELWKAAELRQSTLAHEMETVRTAAREALKLFAGASLVR